MTASKDKGGQVLGPAEELVRLYEQMAKQKNPSDEDVDRLRKLVVSTPGVWSEAIQTMPLIRQRLLEKISHGVARAFMLAEVDILRKQLDYSAASPLERLVIDLILTTRLRVIDAENRYNNCVVNQSISFKTGEYWDSLLSSTQARFLRAIETLGRIRRLARNTPALQINIAREGGKQVNVQGAAPIESDPAKRRESPAVPSAFS